MSVILSFIDKDLEILIVFFVNLFNLIIYLYYKRDRLYSKQLIQFTSKEGNKLQSMV